ncbi:hypothetical protein DOY81_009734, partial [Sarcophaga bullata]
LKTSIGANQIKYVTNCYIAERRNTKQENLTPTLNISQIGVVTVASSGLTPFAMIPYLQIATKLIAKPMRSARPTRPIRYPPYSDTIALTYCRNFPLPFTPVVQRQPCHSLNSRDWQRKPSGVTAKAGPRSKNDMVQGAMLPAAAPPPFEALPSSKSLNVSQTICNMGRQKAPVLPEPVSAAINTSPPPKIKGIASACTSLVAVIFYVFFIYKYKSKCHKTSLQIVHFRRRRQPITSFLALFLNSFFTSP